MPNRIKRLLNHARLLARDPEAFGRNLLQFTDPALFEQRLADIMLPPALHVRVDPALAQRPFLNVLTPAMTPGEMTGGPNTMVNLALRIARLGVPVRFVTTVRPPAIAADWMHTHAADLLGGTPPPVEIATAAMAAEPLPIGPRDLFIATHWTTAQQLRTLLPRMAQAQFFYLLQEVEPHFYGWSSNHALALETYELDFRPIVNERFLADYLSGQRLGRFADPAMAERAIVFEPAIDRRLFHPAEGSREPRRQLLFYARPSNTRNMFGLGLAALREVATRTEFDGWSFLSIGGRGSLPALQLGGGHVLRPAPWRDYAGYAALLREADVLLCPMLSPHTSYPVLEMAASGGVAVTNSFATKTAAALSALSADIVPAKPTIAGFAEALLIAAGRINAGGRAAAPLHMPADWAETLDPAAVRVADICRALMQVSGGIAA